MTLSGWLNVAGFLFVAGAYICAARAWRADESRDEIGFYFQWSTPSIACAAIAIAVFLAAMGTKAHARDLDGRYANSMLKPWFDQLKSGKGPCCSDADGYAISDADWESKDGHYRVRIEGDWHDVPDDAVITEPNRAGRTMVWPIKGWGGLTIRCFMPGPMT